MSKAKIKEYFVSIQGEGPYVGYRQLFIRFCGCNLNCKYCDTDFSAESGYSEFSPAELFKKLDTDGFLENIQSVSLTGGEPLLYVDFLKSFLPLLNGKLSVYLETNATLSKKLSEIINYIDIISADIKLPSSSGHDLMKVHDEFFKLCREKNVFVKVVFDENITEEELESVCGIAEKHDLELVLSPVMKDNKPVVNAEFMQNILQKAAKIYPNVRLIPQVHKFLNLE